MVATSRTPEQMALEVHAAIVSRSLCGTHCLVRIVVDRGRRAGQDAIYDLHCGKAPHSDSAGTGLTFAFTKQDGSVHHVEVAPSGAMTCDCRGFLRWGYCKHKIALEYITRQETARQVAAIDQPILPPSGYAVPRKPRLPGDAKCIPCDGTGYVVDDSKGRRCLDCLGLGFVLPF